MIGLIIIIIERYQWNLTKLSPVEYYKYNTTGEYPLKLGISKKAASSSNYYVCPDKYLGKSFVLSAMIYDNESSVVETSTNPLSTIHGLPKKDNDENSNTVIRSRGRPSNGACMVEKLNAAIVFC